MVYKLLYSSEKNSFTTYSGRLHQCGLEPQTFGS